MPDKQPATFEAKISRLQAIVSELDGGNVDLDKTIALFQEGKKLADECSALLKSTQEQIDRAMQSAPAPSSSQSPDDDIPF
ncbi:MAG: exodeoxyribonuclease VII small subunit [Candidatus Eremiobacteraeota bacterium]|nr:exodeoxyribonuclease VII small subunit [Candidatus Eremiobacteraeota bacterium]